jgi:hypothetical protein
VNVDADADVDVAVVVAELIFGGVLFLLGR